MFLSEAKTDLTLGSLNFFFFNLKEVKCCKLLFYQPTLELLIVIYYFFKLWKNIRDIRDLMKEEYKAVVYG